MQWHEQSWPVIQRLDKRIPVVIPLGSCEQHGRHLPVLVDTFQVAAIAERVEQRLGNQVLMTPALWVGSSHHHLDFPGTISLRPSLYTQVIQDLARCVLRAGFKRFFFLNGHGGNETPVAQALSELVATDDQADACHLALASWWQVGRAAMAPNRHGMASEALSHACEYETSLMLFLRPELVHQAQARDVVDRLKNAWVDSSAAGGRVAVFHRFARFTAPGSIGTPTQATAEKGKSLFGAVVDEIVHFLEDFAHWPLPAAASLPRPSKPKAARP